MADEKHPENNGTPADENGQMCFFNSAVELVPYYAAIGEMAATWATFDSHIDHLIWDIMECSFKRAACLTSQLGSTQTKFKALLALMDVIGRPANTARKVQKISDKAVKLALIRNRLVHDPIFMDVEDGQFKPKRYIVTGDKKLRFEFKPFDLNEANQTIKDMKDLSVELLSLMNEITGRRLARSLGD